MGMLSIILNIVSCIIFLIAGWKLGTTGLSSFSIFHIIVLVVISIVGFLSKFTNQTYLNMNNILKKYKNRVDIIPAIKSILTLHSIEFIFGIFSGPLYSLSVYYMVGFLTSGFKNLPLLAYFLFGVGVFILCSSIVSSVLYSVFQRISNLFITNKELYYESINSDNYIKVIAFDFQKNNPDIINEYESTISESYTDDYEEIDNSVNIYAEEDKKAKESEVEEEIFIADEETNLFSDDINSENIYSDEEDEEEFEI